MGLKNKLLKLAITVLKEPLPNLSNGSDPREIIKNRIMQRFKHKMRKQFRGEPYASYTFEELFDLPEWCTLDLWLTIQLRGRGVDSLLELSLDHIIPCDLARLPEEMVKLQCYKNIRLLDADLNSQKSNYVDNENSLLALSLLGRPLVGEERPEKAVQEPVNDEASNRFAKLMSRGKGQSHRQKVNGAQANKKKKDYRNKKRRK